MGQKFKSILGNKENKTVGIEKNNESNNHTNNLHDGLNNHQNGKSLSNNSKEKDIDIVPEIPKPCINNSNSNSTNVIPPKPLPRTSISEQGSFDESTNNVSPPAPKPKPRLTANSNYKVIILLVWFLRDFFVTFCMLFFSSADVCLSLLTLI